MGFTVKVNMPDGDAYFFSRVYAIDNEKDSFLVANYDGQFIWMPIEQCRLFCEGEG